MATPEPIASGTLAKTPLPHLLVYLDQKKLSGTLALWPDDGANTGQDRVLFLKGRPVAGRLLQPAATLREGLLPLFDRKNAPYAFYEGNLLSDDRVSGVVDSPSLILDAVRAGFRPDVIESVLSRFGQHKVRMQPGVDLARFGLSQPERALVDLLLAGPDSVGTLTRASGLPVDAARGLLYVLAITKSIGPHAESKPEAAPAPAQPGASTPPPPSAPRASTPPPPSAPRASVPPPVSTPVGASASMPPPMSAPPGELHQHIDRLQSIPPPPDALAEQLKQRWMRIITKGRLIENQNYFEMLELDKEAKATDARNKFYQLAKEWHPDRLPSELGPLREYVQIIFSYMSEANTALSDEASRTKYVQTVREGGGTPATDRLMQSILDMAMEYERVLVMTRRHQYDDALELLKRILSMVKDEPDYHAMHAFLLMQKFPGQEAPLKKMLEAADAALALHEAHERANMLKGQILRRMGRPAEALKHFQRVAEVNPNNIEAVREVRVATMRGENPAAHKGKKKEADDSVGGLLGKLFKKK